MKDRSYLHARNKTPKFRINRKFAQSFEKRKQRELNDRYGGSENEEGSSSLSEDEVGALID